MVCGLNYSLLHWPWLSDALFFGVFACFIIRYSVVYWFRLLGFDLRTWLSQDGFLLSELAWLSA